MDSLNVPLFDYRVENVKQVRLDGSPAFASHKDHSKWAASARAQQPWVCVGDINRMVRRESAHQLFFTNNSIREEQRTPIFFWLSKRILTNLTVKGVKGGPYSH